MRGSPQVPVSAVQGILQLPRNRSANISSRSELHQSIELLTAPEGDDMIEETAKAFGQRHVSTLRAQSRVIHRGW